MSEERVQPYSWYALAVLTAVYVLNFLDRSLIYILFTPIKGEMKLTDLQLGALGTLSFVLLYTLLGIPFGRMSDRSSRTKMIAIGLAVWSLFSGLTGFATNFWTLFGCRVMVGVGEATLGPAAFSLLCDFFPARMRATVQSVYASAIALGGGLAFFLGGWIGQTMGWRWAFYLLGFPGLVLALLVFLLREPARTRVQTSERADWRPLLQSPSFRYICLGYALLGLASNNLGIWGTTFYVRVHHVSLMTVGAAAGLLSVVIGVPAMIFGGYVSDRVRRRMAFTSFAALVSVPLWIAVLFTNDIPLLVGVNVVLYALAILWVGPATADVTELAGPQLRGLAIGIFFSAVNISAYAIGAPVIGKLSDAYGLRYALLVCPAVCAMGAVLLWLGSRARRTVPASMNATALSESA
ncbi:MAG TPA: MFS transporter [Thermoanaerobaculia bacterium]|nr:MFS transporter [Thermoanaerobaculia bacterium]